MFDSPYETYILSSRKSEFDKLTLAVKRGLIESVLYTDVEFNQTEPPILMKNVVFVVGRDLEIRDIPEFTRPLPFIDQNGGNKKKVAIDLRAYSRRVRAEDGILYLPKEGDVYLPVVEGVLTLLWDTHYIDHQDMREVMLTVSDAPMRVFSYWLATSLQRKLGFGGDIQVKVQVLAAYHWWSLFQTPDSLGDSGRLARAQVFIARACSISTTLVSDVFEQGKLDGSLDRFVEALSNSGWTLRLESITVDVLIGLIQASWFGNIKSAEQMVVALEYPPTFMATLYQAYSERTAKDTDIAKLAMRVTKRQQADTYQLGIRRLIGRLEDL